MITIPYLTALTTYFSSLAMDYSSFLANCAIFSGRLLIGGTLTIFRRTAKTTRCLNLGSYNYLGFAAADEYCTPRVIVSLYRFSPSTCSTRVDAGTTAVHTELEECVASFVRKPASIVFGMGYATNSAILPVLMGKGGLIISDSLNHNSIVSGARGSGATIRVFQHNSICLLR